MGGGNAQRHIVRREHASHPPKRYLDNYRERKLGARPAFEVFDKAIEYQKSTGNRMNVLLVGPTGAGKTYSALAYAAARGMEVVYISAKDNTDPMALQGALHISPAGTYFYEGELPAGVRGTPDEDGNVRGCIIILDEGQFLEPAVAGFFHPLLQEGRLIMDEGYTIEAHPETLVVATMNPINSTYAGGKRQSAAFMDRFTLQFDVDYDADMEKELVPFESIHQLARDVRDSDDFTTPFSTRLLVNWWDIGQWFGPNDARDQMLARFSASERPVLSTLYDTVIQDTADVFGESTTVEGDLDLEVDLGLDAALDI